MFTDTPKLQPISKSKHNDKNVPSNSINKNCTAMTSLSSSVNKDVTAGELKDSYLNDTAVDNRCNYGSYRSNSFHNQNYQRNYRNREFNDHYSHNSNQSTNFNSSYWSRNWDNNSAYNPNYNRWNSNYNRLQANYRSNFKYTGNSGYNDQKSFAEDSFQCNNFNIEVVDQPEADKVKSFTTKSTVLANKKLTSPKSKNTIINKDKANSVKKQFSPQKCILSQDRKSGTKNNGNTNNAQNLKLSKTNQNNKETSSETVTKTAKISESCNNINSHGEQLSTQDSLSSLENKSDTLSLVNKINEKDCKNARTFNPSVPSVSTEVERDKTESENLKTNNLRAIASNANVIEKQTEEFVNSYPTDQLNLSASISQQSKNTCIEIFNNELITQNQHIKNLEQPTTVLKSTQIIPPPTKPTSHSDSDKFAFHIPKISLIPISRLIATDFWESLPNESLVSLESSKPQSTPNTPHKQLFKPNLIKRKRNVSTCSNSSTSSQNNSATDRIVEKLVTMNKINLKNIINSSDTRYDEALKTQARKRLREEIRRQLKSMNIDPPKNPICSDFVPDEIVDSIDIPDVVFEEIKKALGLELFTFSEDVNMKTIEDILSYSNPLEENSNKGDPINQVPAQIGEDLLSLLPQELLQMPTATETLTNNFSQPSDQGRSNIEQREHVEVKCETKPDMKIDVSSQKSDKSRKSHSRSKSKKLSKRREFHKSKKHRSKDDVVVLISSSSESLTSSSSSSEASSSSSSSSSSSDSESDKSIKSNRSTCSAAKKKRLKLKVDAENVVDSFEKLILFSLSESLRERYRTKYSTSMSTKLHFISCICTSDYNYGNFSKLQIAKVQKNLKSSDCSMALEFLMKEIVNVCNKQKHVAKMEDYRRGSSKSLESSKDTSKENYKSSSHTKKNALSNNLTSTRLQTNNGSVLKPSSSSSFSSEAIQAKSVNAAQKLTTGTNGGKHIQECVTKVLSLYRQEMKVAMQSKESSHQQPCPRKFPATIEQQTRKQQATSMKLSSTSADKNAGNAKQIDERNLQNPINPINQQTSQQSQSQSKQRASILNTGNENSNNDIEQIQTTSKTNGRQCNTPDEKKCVNEALTHFMQMPILSTSDFNSVSTALSNLSTSLMGVTSESYNQQTSFPVVDLETLKNQSPIGEVVVNNLREIDVKLMELHKRKMYIEEMILKLQKDKMEADLLTIKLQNEKFMLLNTAMTANVTSSSMTNIISNNTSSQKKESGVKSIKTETIIISDTPIASKTTPEKRKKIVKSRPIRKAPVTKKLPVSRKRKIPATSSSTTEDSKKTCNEIKTPTKRITKSSLKATEKTPRKTTNKSSPKKTTGSVAKQITDTLPEKTPEEIPPPEKIQIAEINNNPTTTVIDTNVQAASEATKPTYKNMPTGSFEGIRNPITQIRVFEEFIIASSEDGKLYKFDVTTLKLLIHFSKHSEAITQMYLCSEKKVIYTTSLDGYLKKSSLENFALDIQSIYLQEPLQSIEIQWDLAFIGSRWGNIYIYNLTTNTIAEQALCSTESSIISIKATKEGDRKILIVSSKGNLIHLRDATTGVLLRKFDVPESINIYSILLNEGIVYCGTQKKEIRKYDYVSGAYLGAINCGNGAVSMQMYNNKFLFVGCYDGFVYILNKATGKQVGRLAGSGKLILTFEIVVDKIISSAKDNTMKVSEIPSYCLDTNTKRN